MVPTLGRSEPALTAYVETIPNTTVTFRMVPIPSRSLDDIEPFWICTTEVTWDQYDLFVYGSEADRLAPHSDAIARPSKPYLPPDRGFGHAGYPAMSMSFHAAQEFCRWLSNKTGRAYRLPTESEWQRACKFLGLTAFDPSQVWHAGNSGGTTHPVAKRQPNEHGLHDMCGNVAEWCVAQDGTGVAMGGCYLDELSDIGCVARKEPSPDWNASDPQVPKSQWWLADCPFVGFRVICDGRTTGGVR